MYVQKTDILNRGEIVKNLLMITEGLSSRNAASVFALNGDWDRARHLYYACLKMRRRN